MWGVITTTNSRSRLFKFAFLNILPKMGTEEMKGTLLKVFCSSRLRMPEIIRVSPSIKSTVVFVERFRMPQTGEPLVVTQLEESRLLTSGCTVNSIRPDTGEIQGV